MVCKPTNIQIVEQGQGMEKIQDAVKNSMVMVGLMGKMRHEQKLEEN